MTILIAIFRLLFHLFIIALFTVVTQVGGAVHILCIPLYRRLARRWPNVALRYLVQVLAFLGVYLFVALFVVPLLAPQFGRAAMPTNNSDIKPQHWATPLLCRHYVSPRLRRVAIDVAAEMQRKHQTTLLYLDAQHPFFDGWPMVPHLSHSDGRKLDIALLWKDAQTSQPVTGTPSAIGYGVFEDPRPGEYNYAETCRKRGFWQYSYMEKIISQRRKHLFRLDETRTAAMTRLFCQHPHIRRVLIEPYLKQRLGLSNLENLRHQGCNAVRHDDHIHVEM